MIAALKAGSKIHPFLLRKTFCHFHTIQYLNVFLLSLLLCSSIKLAHALKGNVWYFKDVIYHGVVE